MPELHYMFCSWSNIFFSNCFWFLLCCMLCFMQEFRLVLWLCNTGAQSRPSQRSCLMPILSKSLIRIIKGKGSSTESWETLLVTGHQLCWFPFTTTLWEQPYKQVFIQKEYVYPSHKQPVGNNVRWFTKSLWHETHHLWPSSHSLCHLIERDQVSQAWLAILTLLDHFVVLCVLHNDTQYYLLHNLSCHWGQTGSSFQPVL